MKPSLMLTPVYLMRSLGFPVVIQKGSVDTFSDGKISKANTKTCYSVAAHTNLLLLESSHNKR